MTPPAPPVEPRHLEVVAALRTFSERADQVVDDAGRGLGLGRTDLRALSLLMGRVAAGQETAVSDLARGLHLSKPAATAAVDRLVASGHVVRRRSAVDRRRVILDHTPSAVSDGRAAFGPMAERIGAALAVLPDEDLAAALRVVTAASEALRPDPADRR